MACERSDFNNKDISNIVNSYLPQEHLEAYRMGNKEDDTIFSVSTGFSNFDKNLNGGLRQGLHVIGAISGLGKTTFALQLADQIAQSGQDVLFFSLEMSRAELGKKSTNRHLYNLVESDSVQGVNIEICSKLANINYSSTKIRKTEVPYLIAALNNYSLSAKHLYFFEDEYKNHPISANLISALSKKHKEVTGNTPVIFVDYLQVLEPICNRMVDKQNVDDSVRVLRKLSRELHTVVFAISSFNRDNYKEPVNISSFKETGSIEYSADYLYGMQLKGMDYEHGEKEQTRLSRIRELEKNTIQRKNNNQPIAIEIKCLKNRFGCQFSIMFDMMPGFSHFSESK